MTGSIAISVSQSISFACEKYSKEELNDAIQSHKEPDPYLDEDSFPGEWQWEMISNDYSDGYFTRKLLFTFTWEDEVEIKNWSEEYDIDLEDTLLPSYILGDYESLSIGDDFYDYDNSYDEVIT
tara:strand:- start:200 stop:571 length:372 start_codon:yes stop_codon:yes gene_type:complete